MIQNRETGKIVAVAGGSQNGKTTWVIQEIEGHKRVLVWDASKPQYTAFGFKKIATPHELLRTLKENPKGPGRYAYQGKLADFGVFCWAALNWGRLFPATLVYEETSDVTQQGKAPEEYGEVIRTIMGLGCWLIDVSQSPAESTKTVWRNATVKHTHYLPEPADRASVAARMDCTPEEIAALHPYEYLERDFHDGGPRAELVKGKTRK